MSEESILSQAIRWILIVAARRACVVYGTFPPEGTTPEQRENRWRACYDFLLEYGPEYAQIRAWRKATKVGSDPGGQP